MDKKDFIPQSKLLRMLQVIEYLKANRSSYIQLARRFDMSERTARRYIQLFQEVDFVGFKLVRLGDSFTMQKHKTPVI